MAKKTFTDQISTDELRAYKKDKVTAVETIQYNEERTLSDMDLVYWKYIKDILPDSETMSFVGSVGSESELPDNVGDGTVALIGNTLYIIEDGEWVKTGVEAFVTYSDIPTLLNHQAEQNEQQIYIVSDASDDNTLKFPPNATKKHAFYKHRGTTTGDIADYDLISAPYSLNENAVDTYSNQSVDGEKAIIGRIYYTDLDNVIQGLLDEDLAPKKYVDLESFKNLLDENNKIKDQYIPALAIVDMVDATEDTFAAFLVNAENYTYEKGDFIQITDVDGNREYYFYNGGNKTDANNYAPMSTEKIPWGNVSGKPVIDIDYVAGEGNTTDKELKLGKVTVDSIITRGGTDRDVVLGDGELRRLFGVENGSNSLAIGLLSEVEGIASIAIGYSAKAEGNSSNALGRDSIAEGNSSIAIGQKSKSGGGYSIAIGYLAKTSSNNDSIAIGRDASTEEGQSIAIGRGALAKSTPAIAIGFNSLANDRSISIGFGSIANNRGSLAIGYNVETFKQNQIAIGANNIESYDDFIIGNGTSMDKSNLLELNGSGEIQVYSNAENPSILKYKADFEPEEFTDDKMLPNVKYVNTTTDKKIEVAVTTGVYGVEWDITHAAPELTRIGDMDCHKTLPVHSQMRRCILNEKGDVEYYLDKEDSTIREDGNLSKLDGTDGDVMVEIPEHYERYDSAGNIRRVLISLRSFTGARRVPKSYISAYKVTLDRFVAQNPKLMSVASEFDRYRGGDGTETWMNGIASSRYSLADYKEFARYKNNDHDKRNGLWTPAWYELRRKVSWLITIEYATRMHRQEIVTALTPEGYKQGGLGLGPTGVSDADWNAYNGRYSIFKCGTTNSLGNQTGEVAVTIPDFNGTTLNTVAMSYRGIENFFGDIWEWTDGIILDADQTPAKAYAATSAEFSLDNNHGRYIGEVPEGNGYIKDIAFGEHGDIVATENSGASSTTFFTDYYWRNQTTGFRVFAFGARLIHSGYAGSISAFTNYTASNAYPYYGSRLCFITKS